MSEYDSNLYSNLTMVQLVSKKIDSKTSLMHQKNENNIPNKKKYYCKVCRRTYNISYTSFENHKLMHKSSSKSVHKIERECNHCKRKFFSFNEYFNHVSEHFKFCDICKKSFLSKKSLIEHVKNHANDKLFSCYKCCRQFSLPLLLNKHYIDAHSSEKDESSNMIAVKRGEPKNSRFNSNILRSILSSKKYDTSKDSIDSINNNNSKNLKPMLSDYSKNEKIPAESENETELKQDKSHLKQFDNNSKIVYASALFKNIFSV